MHDLQIYLYMINLNDISDILRAAISSKVEPCQPNRQRIPLHPPSPSSCSSGHQGGPAGLHPGCFAALHGMRARRTTRSNGCSSSRCCAQSPTPASPRCSRCRPASSSWSSTPSSGPSATPSATSPTQVGPVPPASMLHVQAKHGTRVQVLVVTGLHAFVPPTPQFQH